MTQQPVNAWVVLKDASSILEASYPMGRLGTLEDAQAHLERVLAMPEADLVEWYGFTPATAEIWDDDAQATIWKKGREV